MVYVNFHEDWAINSCHLLVIFTPFLMITPSHLYLWGNALHYKSFILEIFIISALRSWPEMQSLFKGKGVSQEVMKRGGGLVWESAKKRQNLIKVTTKHHITEWWGRGGVSQAKVMSFLDKLILLSVSDSSLLLVSTYNILAVLYNLKLWSYFHVICLYFLISW